MNNTLMDTSKAEQDISGKIVSGLERISEVFKILLWEKAKLVKLSPIQIQILNFIAFHKPSLCRVSHLAKEFNVTKPTISDAVKVLVRKGMVSKDFSSFDNRSYSLQLTENGKELVTKTHDFATPLKEQIDKLQMQEMQSLFSSISELIYKLNRSGILSVQRTCYGCKFHEKIGDRDYCNLLQKKLMTHEIQLDCAEYEEKIEK